jgi:hypothetical protein
MKALVEAHHGSGPVGADAGACFSTCPNFGSSLLESLKDGATRDRSQRQVGTQSAAGLRSRVWRGHLGLVALAPPQKEVFEDLKGGCAPRGWAVEVRRGIQAELFVRLKAYTAQRLEADDGARLFELRFPHEGIPLPSPAVSVGEPSYHPVLDGLDPPHPSRTSPLGNALVASVRSIVARLLVASQGRESDFFVQLLEDRDRLAHTENKAAPELLKLARESCEAPIQKDKVSSIKVVRRKDVWFVDVETNARTLLDGTG